MAGKGKRDGVTVVIKKEEVVEGGHHGGAWKVAYADFVTAMMAFFLLMWLLNATTEQQRRGLADYFAPSNVLGRSQTGTGQPFGGTTVNSAGNMASDSGALRVERGPAPVRIDVDEEESEGPVEPVPQLRTSEERPASSIGVTNGPPRPPAGAAPLTAEQALTGSAAGRMGQTGTALGGPAQAGELQAGQLRAGDQRQGEQRQGERRSGEARAGEQTRGDQRSGDLQAMMQTDPQAVEAARLADAALRAELGRRERAAFEAAAEDLRAAVLNDPALADLARQLRIEQVPEGLRIQIMDADRQAMFPLSSAVPNDRARALILKVAQVTARLPNGLAIAGHTDSSPFRGEGRSNWDLSADRANAVRRLLVENGVNPARLRSVSGYAEREPLLPADPGNAGNRRVAITLLRQAPQGAGDSQP
jgi:chemotaxis protein MotB